MKKGSIITKVLEAMVGIAMLAIIVVVMIQVIGRTSLLEKSPHWTEELSRMIFVFIVCIGAIIGTARNEFVSVDLFTATLKGKTAKIFQIVIDLLMSVFFFVLIPACNKFVTLGAKQLSPGLRINMKYVYSLIFISIVGMGIANLYKVVKNIMELKNNEEEKKDE